MPKAIRYEVDLSKGHECFPPTLPKNVGDNMYAATRVNDLYEPHECPDGTKHDPEEIFASEGSPNVFANCRPMHREGDSVSCDDVGSNGSPDVYINEPGNSWDIPPDRIVSLSGVDLTDGYPREGQNMKQVIPQNDDECTENYAARATDGQMGDPHISIPEGPVVPNKISNASIPVNCGFEVKTQFALTPGSTTNPNPANPVWVSTDVPSGLTLTPGGMLSGKLPGVNTYPINISVKDGDKVLDSKPFTIQAVNCADGISFKNPIGILRVTSLFMEKRDNGKYHKGIDLSYGSGKSGPIYAAADGIVVLKRFNAGGYGHYICIGHKDGDGKQVCVSLYAHMKSASNVNLGDKVTQGQVVGQVGNTGHSKGNHLHFEIREASFIPSPNSFNSNAKPFDPLKYINGTFVIDKGAGVKFMESNPSEKTAYDPGQTTDDVVEYTETDKIFPAAKNVLPPCEPPPVIEAVVNKEAIKPPDMTCAKTAKSVYSSKTCPDACPTTLCVPQVIEIMKTVFNEFPWMDDEDKKYLLGISFIESKFDPCADNPTSSALGLFQMLDKTAAAFGVKPCHLRANPELATRAQVQWYKKELMGYYNEFKASNGTTMARKRIVQNAHTARYKTLSKSEFMYALLHHDGIGNAVNGVDKGGIGYIKKNPLQNFL